jgi:enediyne biosynthesis protein E4
LNPLFHYSVNFTHKESDFNEFNREGLIYHMLSTQGPCICQGDVDKDGIEDIVVPGSKGSNTSFFKGTSSGSFEKMNITLDENPQSEYIKCILFDANKDGNLDLFLAAGSTEDSEYSDYLLDVLYFNDGAGNFTKSQQAFPDPKRRISTGAVSAGDLNGDGYDDLVIGERVNLSGYGGNCSAFILINDKQGQFIDQTQNLAPLLTNIGMVTDIKIADINGDKKNDIILVGEYLAPHIFINNGQNFDVLPPQKSFSGWWKNVSIADIDNDGDLDLILGNHGQNSRFRVGNDKNIQLYFSDFDGNGFPEGIITERMENGKYYPFDLRHNLLKRLPYLTKKYPDYTSFKNASIDEMFEKSQIDNAKIWEVNEMRSGVLLNDGKTKFNFIPFPSIAQLSPAYDILLHDLNKDGLLDIIMGGNLYEVKPEFGKYDASYGNILINKGSGAFVDKTHEYGLRVFGQVRSIAHSNNYIHFFRNNQTPISYKLQ